MSERIPVAAIVGPTAVGKTAVSLEVAESLGAEIVSIDSMQLYKGMDIGTDKPDRAAMERVPHHLVDVVGPDREITVAEFQAMACAAIEDIHGRGKIALLVGGSGLYFRAAVDALEFPPHSPEVRAELEERADEEGSEALYSRLQSLDPKAAARIEPGNARRIVRALEVIELTGRPFSDNDSWETYESIYDLNVVGLTLEREDLYRRVAERVDRMIERGLVEEAGELFRRGMSLTARQALGYRQVLEGPREIDLLREQIVRATKRFARRQESWFRADPRITWMDADEAGLGGRIVAHFRAHVRLP